MNIGSSGSALVTDCRSELFHGRSLRGRPLQKSSGTQIDRNLGEGGVVGSLYDDDEILLSRRCVMAYQLGAHVFKLQVQFLNPNQGVLIRSGDFDHQRFQHDLQRHVKRFRIRVIIRPVTHSHSEWQPCDDYLGILMK